MKPCTIYKLASINDGGILEISKLCLSSVDEPVRSGTVKEQDCVLFFKASNKYNPFKDAVQSIYCIQVRVIILNVKT